MRDDIGYMPATEMLAAFREKKLSPVEVTSALLERIDALNPAINAYCLVTPEMAIGAAKQAEASYLRGVDIGPLSGVPVSVKDLFDVPGLPTTKGSVIYKDRIARGWEYAAKRLIDAGAVHLGKTNTPEFGFQPTTENKLHGATTNPWDPTRTSGGSSGGSASAASAGLGPIALGSDGGGSIRIPASFCGVFGIKPTYGRIPRNPGGWSTMTHRGPITRTVADTALALDVMAGREPADPYSVPDYPGSFLGEVDRGIEGLRVAWSADLGYALVEPEVRDICEAAAKRFADLGCVVEVATPKIENPQADRTFIILAAAGDAVWIGALSDAEREQIGETAHVFLEFGRPTTAMDYVQANDRRMAIWHEMQRFHQTYDLLLTPTLSLTAFPIGNPPKTAAGSEVEFPPFGWSPYTMPFNLSGQPAAPAPCGSDARGLPVGLHIVGRAFEDATVLRAARAFQPLQPWAKAHPPIAAVMSH